MSSIARRAVNAAVVRLLAQPRLGRRAAVGLVALRVRGHHSGRLATFPVQYAVDPVGLVVMPRHHLGKSWWLNLVGASDVQVLWCGEWRNAKGWVIWPTDPDYPEVRATYRIRWPHLTADWDQPYVRVAFDPAETRDDRDQASLSAGGPHPAASSR